MRFVPILAAATIGLFATAAVAQNMNTSTTGNPNRPSAGQMTRGQMSNDGMMMKKKKMSKKQRMMMMKKKKMMMNRDR